MRRSNIWICTEVDIQQGCLCTFKHDGLSSLVSFIRQNGNICNVRSEPLAIFDIFCNNSIQIKCSAAVNSSDNLVFQFASGSCLLSEDFRMYQVIHPPTAAFVLVHVSWANSTLCCTDVGISTELFRQTV